MDNTNEIKIVRWILIITIISSVVGLVIFDWIYFQTPDNVSLQPTFIKSGFGEITLSTGLQSYSFSNDIYQDKKLGFQILKPNNNWKIISMADDMGDEEAKHLKTKGFLGGVYLTQDDKTRFMIAVFDVNGKSSFELAKYVDTQIETMKDNPNVEVTLKQVSPSNDWSIFGVHDHSGTLDKYGEQFLYFENGKLYMIQYTGLSPSEITSDVKSEYRSILDSFEIIE